MGKTVLSIHGEDFYINGARTYSEILNSSPRVHGLLMNARFIQGIFDDQHDRTRFHRFGKEFDPERNTDELIAALPVWYAYGLRAFTVGFQGGGPCFTIKSSTIHNNPFGADGKRLDEVYASRMDRVIRAADRLGMAVIVSYFYPDQVNRLEDARAVIEAVKTASRFLKEGSYTNVIIEICNEHNLVEDEQPLISSVGGMVALMDIAREASGGLPVGCSASGGVLHKEVCRESDVVLIHGNSQSRQSFYNLSRSARICAPNKPVLCNEDSPALGNMEVALKTHASWGYYNNMTKQEPPSDWLPTRGEDQFFAQRMAEAIGMNVPPIPKEEQYYLQGLEPEMTYEGKRWIRLLVYTRNRLIMWNFIGTGSCTILRTTNRFPCITVPIGINGNGWYSRMTANGRP
jgi:hypothetical protein